jgi:hypothetical protein
VTSGAGGGKRPVVGHPHAVIKQSLTYLAIDTYSDDQPAGWEFDDRLLLDDFVLDDGTTGKKP